MECNKRKYLLRSILSAVPVQDILYPLCAPSEVHALTEIAEVSLSEYQISSLLNPMREITNHLPVSEYEPMVYSPHLPEAIERIKKPGRIRGNKNIHLCIVYVESTTLFSVGTSHALTQYKYRNASGVRRFRIADSVTCSYTNPMLTKDCVSINVKKIHKSWRTNFSKVYYMGTDCELRSSMKTYPRPPYPKIDYIFIHIFASGIHTYYDTRFNTIQR